MNDAWLAMNQQHLSRALRRVQRSLERHISSEPIASDDDPEQIDPALPPPALDLIAAAFGLTAFERDVLVLCAGVELDTGFASLLARAQHNPSLRYPTFSLALAALPDSHWSALSPDAALRRWRLIELTARDEPITTTPLRLAERILHYLTGIPCEEETLRGIVQSVPATGELPPSQQSIAAEIAGIFVEAERGHMPAIQLCGRAHGDKRAIAAAACEQLGLGLRALRVSALPIHPAEQINLARIWEREATLSGWGLLIECDEHDALEHSRLLSGFLDAAHGVVLVAAREPVRDAARPMVRIDVALPCPSEQRELWQSVLGPAASSLNGSLDQVLSHFDLSAHRVRAISAQAQLLQRPDESFSDTIWEACRIETRPRLEGLAQRIEASAHWDDLILPRAQLETLREIAAQLRARHVVYHTWGFADRGARGLGIAALFAGASGTGKTFAAEVLATELKLDLYRIDLSQVVSKYIGETEKNLRRVFEAAESSGAILLFDEADALFGKRSEVKDSHDRYANIEVSYLLQQMEAYRGLAILTTNLKQALDTSFVRRLRFVVQFPFPGPAERGEIWRRAFPAATPREDLDLERLARLNVTGGNIRNIALNAAFRAARDESPVRMSHLLHATRGEYEKLEKPLTQSETEGWA
jgi:hypothetical protein